MRTADEIAGIMADYILEDPTVKGLKRDFPRASIGDIVEALTANGRDPVQAANRLKERGYDQPEPAGTVPPDLDPRKRRVLKDCDGVEVVHVIGYEEAPRDQEG